MIKVYIASPYTKGDVAANVRASMDAFDALVDAGFAPYSPLLSHFQQIVHPRGYDKWLELDLEWLRACDCVLRLSGESAGADRECKEAANQGIDLYFDIDALKEDYLIDVPPDTKSGAYIERKKTDNEKQPCEDCGAFPGCDDAMDASCESLRAWRERNNYYKKGKDMERIECVSDHDFEERCAGRKDDADKIGWDLLPWGPMQEVVKVLMFGAKKYGDDNWQRVPEARKRYSAALMRHFVAHQAGEMIDKESGVSHLAHAVCCALFLMWFDKKGDK